MLKRIFAGLFLLLLLVLAGVYLLIPARVSINNNITVNTTDAHVFQFLSHQKEWKKWWSGVTISDEQYKFRTNVYTINQLNNDDVVLTITNPKLSLTTKLSFIATDANKVNINWAGAKTSGLNPISRFRNCEQVEQVGRDLNLVLQHLKRFLEDDRNIYQINVRISKVKDPTILATNTITRQYPKMSQVYELVDELKQEIHKQKAKETGVPMLNVYQTDYKKYEVMVGIPVNKVIHPPKNMVLNKMVLGGNILETTVKGGLNTTHNAFNQLEKYKKDHNLISPAMPFESLITDRLKESDTTKWVTKIYYPIY